MHRSLTTVLFLVPTIATAQSFTGVTATAASLTATYGAQTQSVTLTAGPMGTSNGAQALAMGGPIDLAYAEVAWGFGQDPTQAYFSLLQELRIVGTAAASAAFGPSDFLLSLQAPTPTTVLLELRRELVLAAGMALPTVQVDVGDDGSFELTSSGQLPPPLPVAIGAAGVPIRVRTQVALGGAGYLLASVTLRALPSHTVAHPIAAGCTPPDLRVIPHFAGDVSLASGTWSNEPWLAVIGLSLHPVLLNPLDVCLLLPSPDIVLWDPFTTVHTIPVPAAVRPVHFWAQAVRVGWTSLLSSEAFAVEAR
jgi:hypothetical protein